MELHKKTLFAACLGAFALLMVVFASTRLALVHSFETIEAAEAWFEENDPEGVSFEYEVSA